MTDAILPEIAKTIASQGLLFAVLVAIIVTGIRATWVPGFAWQQMKMERDEAIKTLDQFVDVHEGQARLMQEHAEQMKRVVMILERIDRKTRGRATHKDDAEREGDAEREV